MISYKLALALKEAGFSQKVGDSYGEHLSPLSGQIEVWKRTDERNCKEDFDSFVYIPTLSELIEVMPMRQKYLGTVNDAHFVLRKLVSASKNSYRAYYEDEDTNKAVKGYEFIEEGADVAVAKLWLKLNENSAKEKT